MKDHYQLSRATSRKCAKAFVDAIITPYHQWDTVTLESYLPDGWQLDDYASTEQDITIPNITNIARVLQQHANRIAPL